MDRKLGLILVGLGIAGLAFSSPFVFGILGKLLFFGFLFFLFSRLFWGHRWAYAGRGYYGGRHCGGRQHAPHQPEAKATSDQPAPEQRSYTGETQRL